MKKYMMVCFCLICFNVYCDDLFEAQRAQYWFEKGLYLEGKKSNHKEALEAYNKALEIAPWDANIWNNKGVSLNGLRRYEEAIKCFDEALRLNPNVKNSKMNKEISLNLWKQQSK